MSDDPRHEARDERLRGLFHALREQDRRRTPPFRVPVAPAPGRGWTWVPLPAAALVALVVATVALWPGAGDVAVDDGVSLADWVAPSDSFLELGGVSLSDFSDPSELSSEEMWLQLPTDDLLDPLNEAFEQEQQL